MTNLKRTADSLESIAASMEELVNDEKMLLKNNNKMLSDNERMLDLHNRNYNLNVAAFLTGATESLGNKAVEYLDAISAGDIVKANNILLESKSPKKEQKAKTDEAERPVKRRGRPPKNAN